MISRSLARADRAAGGLAADAALYGLSAVFALVTALASTLTPHRAWGAVAVWGYLGALACVLVQWLWIRKGRAALAWLTFAAVCVLPMIIQAVQRAAGRTDRAQEEVVVVEEMGKGLAQHGTPYLSRAEIAALPAADQLGGYHPYQPGMALFGLPRAWFGDVWWTDSRIWFAVATVAAIAAVVPGVRALQAATVLPVCALTLATGGDDLPVLALCLLAFALCARDRYTAAGLAVGAAAALKLLALPVVIVLAVHAVVTGRWRQLLPGAIGLPVLALVPPVLTDAGALVENVLSFPLGHGLVESPAQSPFPGHLIATTLPGGRIIAAALLVGAGLAIAVLLLRRPPRTAATAAQFCGYGLLTAILLMPTTRFGYLLYPIAILVWAAALSRLSVSSTPRVDEALYRR